jgi:hypothetical protein
VIPDWKGGEMMKKKSIWVATTTLALSLAIGGGLWADPSVNAASSTSSSKANAALDSTSTDKAEHAGKQGKRDFGFGLGKVESQLAEYLKLSSEDLKERLKTATLAEVASEQGISRDDLKAKLVEWLDVQIAELPSDKADKLDSSAIAEKLLDAKGGAVGGRGMIGGGKGELVGQLDNTALLELLGLTAEELKADLKDGKSLAAIAEKQGVDVQKVIDLEVSAAKAKLDEELSSGKMTQEQYDTKLASVTGRVTKQVNGTLEFPGKGQSFKAGFGDNMALLELLGLTAEELKADLKDGQSLAAIAEKQGVDVQKVIDLQVSEAKAKLDEVLASGKLTQEQYDSRLAEITDRVTKQVNGTFEFTKEARGGHMGGGHFGKGKGAGAEAPSQSSAASSTTA